MNKFQFRLTGIAAALVGAGIVSLPAGVQAAKVNPTFSLDGPKLSGTFTVPKATGATKIRVTSTHTAAAAISTMTAFFVNSSGVSFSTAPLNFNASGASNFSVTVPGAAATASGMVLGYQLNAPADDYTDTTGTTNFLVIGTAGTVVRQVDGTVANAQTNTVALAGTTAGQFFSLSTTYAGPMVTSSAQAGSVPTGAVTLTFNAGLAGDNTGTTTFGGTGANASLSAKLITDGNNIGGSIFMGAGGTVGAAGGTTVGVGPASFGTGSFSQGVNKVALLASTLFDQAGNPNIAQTVYSVFTNTTGVSLASGAAQALLTAHNGIGTEGLKVDFWNPATAAAQIATGSNITISVRTNEALANSGGFPTTGVSLTPAIGTLAGAVANGTNLDITITGVTRQLGVNASGQLIASTDNFATSTPVTVGLTSNSTNTWSAVSSGTAISTSGVAAVNVYASEVAKPALGYLTLDSDVDGFLDGITIRTTQFNASTNTTSPTQPTFAGTAGTTVGSTGGPTLVHYSNQTISYAGTATLQTGTTAVNIVLTAKQFGDWDADGATGSAGDTTAFGLARFGTGVTGAGAAGVPFTPRIAPVPTTGTVALTYGNLYRATDGGLAPVNNTYAAATTAAAFTDNAPPVLVASEYTKSVSSSATRSEYGTTTMHFSETIDLPGQPTVAAGLINEILIGGQTPDVLNLDSLIDRRAQMSLVGGKDPVGGGATVADRAISLAYLPVTSGKAITFLSAGGDVTELGTGSATDADLVGLINANVGAAGTGANTVSTLAPAIPTFSKAALIGVSTPTASFNGIVVTYSENVNAPAIGTAATRDGLYVVRARVGATREKFETRDTANPAGGSTDTFYDWYIPGSSILIGTASPGGPTTVTLLIPNTSTSAGLPADTTAIYVDYQGSNSTSSGFNVRGTTQSRLLDIGNGNIFNGQLVSGGTAAVTETSMTVGDADTHKVTFSPSLLANNAADNQTKRLLTQTILGTALDGAADLGKNTAIRADLIVVRDAVGLAGTAPRDASFADGGSIDLNRGPNSEAGTVQTVALKTTGVLAQKDFADYSKALRDYNAAYVSKVRSASVTNTTRITELLKPERDLLLNRFNANSTVSAFNATTLAASAQPTNTFVPITGAMVGTGATGGPTGRLFAYVEVTTGSGKDGTAWSNQSTAGTTSQYSGNPNSEFGRTATLMKNLPNIQRNGTTYYPVEINMDTGGISRFGSATNPVSGGGLMGSFPAGAELLGTSASSIQKRFQILDTAYALVENGDYRVIVGAPETDFTTTSSAITPLGSRVTPESFVQISVFDGVKGYYKVATTADPSFSGSTSTVEQTSHIKFSTDLSRTGIPTRFNVNLQRIGETTVLDQNAWQLLGITGELDRDTTKNLSPRVFMTAQSADGAPTASFDLDNKTRDEAFALGLDAAVVNKLGVMFEGSPGNVISTMSPKPVAGLGFNANAAFSGVGTNSGTGVSIAGESDGILNDTPAAGSYRWFYPIKLPTVAKPNPKATLKNGSWHLVTIQVAKTINATGDASSLAAKFPNITALIIVDGTSTSKGARAWFRKGVGLASEDATVGMDSTTLAKGTAVFVYAAGTTSTANFE